MQELKNGESIDLTTGIKAKVIKELGRGGQCIVYLVDVCGKQMALKWYTNLPPKADAFYKNLETNIRESAPSEAFLWPEHITIKTKNSFGYVMQLRPQDYFEFGNYLLARTQFKSFEAMVNRKE